jgi:hypothetical protein
MKSRKKADSKFSLKPSSLAQETARSHRKLPAFLALAALAVAGIVAYTSSSTGRNEIALSRDEGKESPPKTLTELLALPPQRLTNIDIARMNLLCAEGLPGADNLVAQDCLATLEQWAAHVKSETERHLYKFRANPGEFENSEGYFRMLMMAVIMYEDFMVRYNPQKISVPGTSISGDHFFADSRDILLHGLLGPGRTGTCSSMPVLYIALGRRLGYPLKLVTTKAHLFIRWEDASGRFDLEATGKGMNKYDDAHFRSWPFPVSDQEIAEKGYLKSLTPVEELSVFLSIRAECLMENGRLAEVVTTFEAAYRLVPYWKGNQVLLAAAREKLAAGWRPNIASARRPSVEAIIRQTEMSRRLGPGVGPDPNPLLRMRPPGD